MSIYAILLAVRVCALIAGTSLLTYTTSPIVLTDAIEPAAPAGEAALSRGMSWP
ncbi:hypothetical protein [Gemmiger formicilis]|uniref:hypothetical protein n=1 Tax=Gemmiger formicilis TaxID=745368 RepID=UPI003CCB6D39